MRVKKSLIKKCLICGKVLGKDVNRSYKSWQNAKYCSYQCYWESLKGQDRGGKIELTCQYCGKKFKVEKHFYKHRNAKFCSRKCASKGRRKKKRTLLTCKNCGRIFYGGKLSAKFCSKKCFIAWQKGKNHPSWQGGISSGYDRFKISKRFKEWRSIVFKRDNYTCQICSFRSGKGEHRDLHPHHILSASEYPQFRLNIDNGLTLCNKCHGVIHSRNFKNRKC